MASDSELRNLGEALQVTLDKLHSAGINITFLQEFTLLEGIIYAVTINPIFICPKCKHWSPADRCLWCKPDDFDGGGVA